MVVSDPGFSFKKTHLRLKVWGVGGGGGGGLRNWNHTQLNTHVGCFKSCLPLGQKSKPI
jgi:hypothetical protein